MQDFICSCCSSVRAVLVNFWSNLMAYKYLVLSRSEPFRLYFVVLNLFSVKLLVLVNEWDAIKGIYIFDSASLSTLYLSYTLIQKCCPLVCSYQVYLCILLCQKKGLAIIRSNWPQRFINMLSLKLLLHVCPLRFYFFILRTDHLGLLITTYNLIDYISSNFDVNYSIIIWCNTHHPLFGSRF